MQRDSSVVGVILAGGRSSRMGTNKALLPLKGKPMIQWVVESLSSVFENVLISADQEEDYKFLRYPIVPDVRRNSGPLGGIHATLIHAAPHPIFVLPCDMPYFPPDSIRTILAFKSKAPVRVLTGHGHVFPLCGYYDQRALPFISTAIASGALKMTELIRSINADVIPLRDLGSTLLNVNEPSDLAFS